MREGETYETRVVLAGVELPLAAQTDKAARTLARELERIEGTGAAHSAAATWAIAHTHVALFSDSRLRRRSVRRCAAGSQRTSEVDGGHADELRSRELLGRSALGRIGAQEFAPPSAEIGEPS